MSFQTRLQYPERLGLSARRASMRSGKNKRGKISYRKPWILTRKGKKHATESSYWRDFHFFFLFCNFHLSFSKAGYRRASSDAPVHLSGGFRSSRTPLGSSNSKWCYNLRACSAGFNRYTGRRKPRAISDRHIWEVKILLSFYLDKVPWSFLFLGMRNEKAGSVYQPHSPYFTIDEDVFPIGASIYAAFAHSYLSNSTKKLNSWINILILSIYF